MMHFSGWNIFGTLGSLLSAQGINIILNIFFGPVAVAARAISMQVSGGLSQFVNGFQQAVTPQITKLYASNQLEEMNKLLYQNSKYAFLLLWFLALPVLVQTEYILNLWLVEVPQNAIVFCQIIIVHGLISSLNRPYVMAIHATGNMKQTNVTAGVILILVLPISYLLLDNGFSIITPLIIYMIATILCFMIELYYLKKWINVSVMSLFKNTLFPVAIITILSIVPLYLMMDLYENSFIKFLLVTFFSMAIVFVLSYLIALSKEEKIKIKTMIKNKTKR
jgi:O-antigen/teichoic acid export membrane protein